MSHATDRAADGRASDAFSVERWFDLLAENTADVVFQSVEGVLGWISPNVVDVLGWAPEDLIGRTSEPLWHPADVTAAGELTEYARNGEPGRGVYRLRHRDGHYVWVEIRTRPYRDLSDAPGATGSIRDVTALVETERALAASETTRHLILETLPDPFALLTAVRDDDGAVVDFVFTAANAAACALEGRTEDDLVGASFLAVHPTAPDQLYFEKLVAVVETGEPLVLDDEDYVLEHEGGQTRWFDLRATRVGDAVSQVVHDVTDRHLAVEALRRSQEEYRLVAENASDVVYRTGPDGTFAWVSDSVTDLLGWAPQELVGTDGADLVHPDDRATLDVVRSGMLPGVPATVNLRLRRTDGGYRWASVLFKSVRDESGAELGLVGGIRDIDEQVRALRSSASVRDRHVLLESMANEVVALEVDGRIQWVSAAVERLLGWEPAELAGQPAVILWDPRDDVALERLRTSAFDGESEPVVCRLRDMQGETVWAQVVARPWITREDEDAIAYVITDHRPMHHAAGALLSLQERLDAAERRD